MVHRSAYRAFLPLSEAGRQDPCSAALQDPLRFCALYDGLVIGFACPCVNLSFFVEILLFIQQRRQLFISNTLHFVLQFPKSLLLCLQRGKFVRFVRKGINTSFQSDDPFTELFFVPLDLFSLPLQNSCILTQFNKGSRKFLPSVISRLRLRDLIRFFLKNIRCILLLLRRFQFFLRFTGFFDCLEERFPGIAYLPLSSRSLSGFTAPVLV